MADAAEGGGIVISHVFGRVTCPYVTD